MSDRNVFPTGQPEDKILSKAYEIYLFFEKQKDLEKCFDSQEAYDYFANLNFIFAGKIDSFIKLQEIGRLHRGNELLCEILIKLSSICDKLEFGSLREPPFGYSYVKTTLNERRIYFLLYTLRIINRLVPVSLDFRDMLIKQNGLKALLDMVKSEAFIQNLFKYDQASVGYIIYNISWLSKNADSNKKLWHALNTIEILLNFSKKIDKSRIFIYMIICNVVDDKDIENITEIKQITEAVSKMFIDCVNMQEKQYMKNEFIDDENNTKHEFSIKYIRDDQDKVKVSVTGLLLTLYRISLNDQIKWNLFNTKGLVEAIKKLVNEGNDVEKQYALRLLTQLCFEDKVLVELRKDIKFNEFVAVLFKEENITFKRLYQTCEQYLWLIKEKTIGEYKIDDDQIIITLASTSRPLGLKLKSVLEQNKFEVWIDHDETKSIEEIAQAIEESTVVLICVDEKYRQSVSCQAEAQFAYKLKKRIVPLINQEGYGSLEGWLGFIIADKPAVDFTANSFDEALKSLIEILKPTQKEFTGLSKIETKPDPSEEIDETDPMKWTETTVEKKLREKDIEEVWEILKPIKGSGLYQLHQMQETTPEFFHKALTVENKNLDFHLLISFSNFLKETFDKPDSTQESK